jgi:hypothetical protein
MGRGLGIAELIMVAGVGPSIENKFHPAVTKSTPWLFLW